MLNSIRYIRNIAGIVFFGALLFSEITFAQGFPHRSDPTSNTEVVFCRNRQFAMCMASYCTPTGKTISVNQPNNGTTAQYPEVICNCPVLPEGNAGAVANINGGNMAGSCDNTGNPYPGGVWSLFQHQTILPQEIYGWNSQDAPSNRICSRPVNTPRKYANCFSFACEAPQKVTAADGSVVNVSKCHCPLGEDVWTSLPARPGSGFLTQFGGYLSTEPSTIPPYEKLTQAEACNAIPVNGL